MPKSTFYRLSEEKQKRILDAAKQEFLRVPYNEASINKIIKAAEIPRGSFYQYFEDKRDVFLYAVSEQHDKIMSSILDSLQKAKGDFFLFSYDYIDNYLHFCRTKEYGKIILSLTDGDTLRMICGAVNEHSSCKDSENDIRIRLFQEINFDDTILEDREDRMNLLNTIGTILRDGMFRIFQSHTTGIEEEICAEMKSRIRFLEKYFKKNIKE